MPVHSPDSIYVYESYRAQSSGGHGWAMSAYGTKRTSRKPSRMFAYDPKQTWRYRSGGVTQGTLPIRLSDILLECWPSLRRVAMERREFIKIVSGRAYKVIE